MAALLATSLLATACPRPDAQPAVLATSALPTNMSYGMALEAVSP